MVQIGFDVGGSKIAAGVVNDRHKILARKEIPFPTGTSYKIVAEIMAVMGEELLKSAKLDLSSLQSIGISVPGDIDEAGGTVLNAHNLQFHNVPLQKEMKDYFKEIPVFLSNDANAAALAELYAGAFRGVKTAVLLTLGTGVGGGLILDGKLFNGGQGHGVELGHMMLSHNGSICSCGNKGCVETLCSASWLIREGRKAVIEYPNSLIFLKAEGSIEKINARLVIDCARDGDAVALDIFTRYVDQLSSAIASCANLLDPEVIALGGGVSRAGEFLFAPLRKQVEEKSYFHVPYRIVPAELGNDAGIIGAAMLINNK